MIMVRIVAKPRPAMMVMDMLTKKTSDSSGIRPRMVVAAASTTGRSRLTAGVQDGGVGLLALLDLLVDLLDEHDGVLDQQAHQGQGAEQ